MLAYNITAIRVYADGQWYNYDYGWENYPITCTVGSVLYIAVYAEATEESELILDLLNASNGFILQRIYATGTSVQLEYQTTMSTSSMSFTTKITGTPTGPIFIETYDQFDIYQNRQTNMYYGVRLDVTTPERSSVDAVRMWINMWWGQSEWVELYRDFNIIYFYHQYKYQASGQGVTSPKVSDLQTCRLWVDNWWAGQGGPSYVETYKLFDIYFNNNGTYYAQYGSVLLDYGTTTIENMRNAIDVWWIYVGGGFPPPKG